MSLPCPSVNEAIAFVQANMRYDAKLPMCEIVGASQSADIYGLSGHGYFVRVTARFLDESGLPQIAEWVVWNERLTDEVCFLYGEW